MKEKDKLLITDNRIYLQKVLIPMYTSNTEPHYEERNESNALI